MGSGTAGCDSDSDSDFDRKATAGEPVRTVHVHAYFVVLDLVGCTGSQTQSGRIEGPDCALHVAAAVVDV